MKYLFLIVTCLPLISAASVDQWKTILSCQNNGLVISANLNPPASNYGPNLRDFLLQINDPAIIGALPNGKTEYFGWSPYNKPFDSASNFFGANVLLDYNGREGRIFLERVQKGTYEILRLSIYEPEIQTCLEDGPPVSAGDGGVYVPCNKWKVTPQVTHLQVELKCMAIN